ncbi:MAG TPA: hypothetical protein PKO41_06360 [Dokdonella sp.]|uniref:hypothetical protein n=1 Tax=Dokdonella sp. TaxID=2291710 RepID=UPI0025BB80B5|nr:hypothetical protein [Dokdonella sp.]MBX3692423.1 hypothetical protein [Dokdonella sp.]MCW5566679.1 hypothetical protein [Dokdonella sp.]HNR92030.1 hypothetical protein [Dokdonella sp.]
MPNKPVLFSTALAVAIAAFAANVHAKKLPDGMVESITKAFNEDAAIESAQGRFAADGRALTLFQPAFRARVGTPESMAREFLAARVEQLGLKDNPTVLEKMYERDDQAFHVVRFTQHLDGVPVYGSDIAVTVRPDGEVIFVSSELRPDVQRIVTTSARASSDLRAKVVIDAGMPAAKDEVEPTLVVYADAQPTRLAWMYYLRDVVKRGSWEVIADAATGEILAMRNTELYVDGTATVFDPDPLTSARTTYGSGAGQLTDANDADSAGLTAQLMNVTLRDITFAGGVYRLEGPWARCNDWEAPFGGVDDCPTPSTPDFSATRASQAFEGPNLYHLIDKQMRYLNVTLGVTVVPNNVAGGVRFDPHGWNGQDNSSFTPATDRLSFGEGGVDDAEDADVVIHELGHGLHDWVTNGGLSQVQGLSEGVGDYFGNSYNRSTGYWTPSDPQWFWMFHWDGHNQYWAGRVTNWHIGRSWPSNIGSGIHAQGQYWASCNMVAWTAIGRDKMDKAMLRGLAMTTSSSNQQVAAQAVITAAATMGGAQGYTPADIAAIGAAYNTSCTYGVSVPQTDIIFQHGFE